LLCGCALNTRVVLSALLCVKMPSGMSSSSSAKSEFVTVARILRSRGNKGEVVAELHTDFPERLKSLPEVLLASATSQPRAVALKNFWLDRNHPGFGVFHFEGVTSINDAEKLRGMEVQIPFEQRVALPAGSYFVTDLIGCSVFELGAQTAQPAATPIGTVRDVFFPGESQPGTPLLAIDTARGEVLVPLAEDICKLIDISALRIEAHLPDGLLEPDAAE
jgi:16S rRNA processing protein RimM